MTRSSTSALILALGAWTSHLIAAPVITTATNTPATETSTTSCVPSGATKGNVTDSSSIPASEIDVIRFDILDAFADDTVFRKITTPPPPTTLPTLNTLPPVTPVDAATNVPVAEISNLNITASSAGLVAKVFLLGGQSNMVGQALSSQLPTSPVNLQQPQNDVLFFYPGSGLTTLRPGSGGDPPPSGLNFGPEVTFGRAIADASPTVTYAIIKHAENGTALYNDWAPGTGASYTAFRNTVSNGLAALQNAGYTTEIVGMLWHQGESDAIEGQQASYGNNLTAFIADIRSRYGASLPFFIGEIRRSNGPAYVTVADAQIAVAGAVPYASFVPASDLTFSDAFHFDAPSQRTLGERFAASYAAIAPSTFNNWIRGFPDVGNQTGIAQDPDGDGSDNGVENFFGTHPGEFSPGLVAGPKNHDSFSFTHPQSSTPATDVTVVYQWSKDLVSFRNSGATDADGTTVTLTPQPHHPAAGTTTVTAEMSGTLSGNLFLRVAASSD